MKNLMIGGLFILASVAYGRPYKFYLDPFRAEQTLATVNLRPRLGDEDWLRLINFKKDEKRRIRPGDSLWRISQARFGNPFLWSKLWQENPWLSNPHELEVGRMLAYYREGSNNQAVKRVPIIKLRPEKGGTVSDLDNDIYVNRVLKARYRVNYLVIKEEDILGEFTGAYNEREMPGPNDDLYLSFNEGKSVEEGAKFAIVRETSELIDKTLPGNPVIGRLVRLIGEVKILATEGQFTKAEMIGLFYPMQRGDKVILIPEVTGDSNAEFPNKDLIPQIVMVDDFEKLFASQGQLVVLNKGRNHGMKEGYLFKVFEDTDPLRQTRDNLSPASKGEIRVVFLGDDSSVGVINRNSRPLKVGDSLVSFPELPDRPGVPKKLRQEVDIE